MYFEHISQKTKTVADDLNKIDIRQLNKEKYLKTYIDIKCTFTNSFEVYLQGRINDQSYNNLDIRYKNTKGYPQFARIEIASTPCNFGGYRHWFLCPGIGKRFCNRRVAVLYFNNEIFACRHCHNLTYNSRVETRNRIYSLKKWGKVYQEIERLRGEIKRIKYAGKETVKYKKLRRLWGLYYKYERISKKNLHQD
jgi:hypothetical protein